jgi:activator of HSP90 ATPase
MEIIKQNYKIKSPVKKVWAALVDPKIIAAWGAGPAKMSAKKDEKFSLWGGEILGKNIEVIPEKKLKQEWFGGDWPEPSILTILLKKKKGATEITLEHKNVPAEEFNDISDGWKDYYLGPMKEYLEKKIKI